MKGNIFDFEKNLSGKMVFDTIIQKSESCLNDYLDSERNMMLGIIGILSPSFEIIGENSDKVFQILENYMKEKGKPYIDNVETFI